MSRDAAIATEPETPTAARRITRANVGLYLLADHLDAALAAGEDLLACTLRVGAPHSGMAPDDIRAEQAELRSFIERVRALEMALVSRVLQARRRATELPKADDAHVLMLNLLLAGTESLGAAVREVGDRVQQQFLTGTGHLAYLRSRGFLQTEAACLGAIADLRVTEAFLVYGRLPLGSLLDLVAAFLDKLDLVFDLYPEPKHEAAAVPGDEAAVAARMQALRAAAERGAAAAVPTVGEPKSDPSTRGEPVREAVSGIETATAEPGQAAQEASAAVAPASTGAATEIADALAAADVVHDAAASQSEDVTTHPPTSALVPGGGTFAPAGTGAQSLADALAQIRAQRADRSDSLTDRISRVAQTESGPTD